MNNSVQSQVIEESAEITHEKSELSETLLISTKIETDQNENNVVENKVIDQVGHLTRILHDSLRELGYDKRLEDVTAEVPEARDKLSYVATKTEEAADRVLNATEIALPIQEQISNEAINLSEQWKQALETEQSLPPDTKKFKDLLIQTLTFLDEVPKQTAVTNTQLMKIMMAQDFQDLTGQVIKKVTKIVQDVENELLQLLVENMPQDKKSKNCDNLMNGPVVNPKKQNDIVANQDQVDDLLASLGF